MPSSAGGLPYRCDFDALLVVENVGLGWVKLVSLDFYL